MAGKLRVKLDSVAQAISERSQNSPRTSPIGVDNYSSVKTGGLCLSSFSIRIIERPSLSAQSSSGLWLAALNFCILTEIAASAFRTFLAKHTESNSRIASWSNCCHCGYFISCSIDPTCREFDEEGGIALWVTLCVIRPWLIWVSSGRMLIAVRVAVNPVEAVAATSIP